MDDLQKYIINNIPVESEELDRYCGKEYEATLYKTPESDCQLAVLIDFKTDEWSNERKHNKDEECLQIINKESVNSRAIKKMKEVTGGKMLDFIVYKK